MICSVDNPLRELQLKNNRALKFTSPLIMGALNVTPDSFSDGGKYLMRDAAEARVREVTSEGANIIDIGGQSIRPGSESVTLEEELERVVPVIKSVRLFSDIPISIDTTKSEVARQAIMAGADMINDVSALRTDIRMIEVARQSGAPIILMHMLGTPKTMQANPHYEDCVKEIILFLSERIEYCESHGISRDKIIIDPGIGFGKRLKDNLAIIQHLEEFKNLGCPILMGTSRKSFIGMITGKKDEPEKRIGGSIASALLALMKGADIIRVHDVAASVEAIKVLEAIKGSA